MIRKILCLSFSVCMAMQAAAEDDRVVFEPHQARVEVLYQMDHYWHSHSNVSAHLFRFDEPHIVSAILCLHITYQAKAYIDRTLHKRFLIRVDDARDNTVKLESDNIAFIRLKNYFVIEEEALVIYKKDKKTIQIKEDGSILVELSDAMLAKIGRVNPRIYSAVRLCKEISEHDAKILWRAQECCKLLADQHEEQHDVVLQYEQPQAKGEGIFASLYDFWRG